MFTILGVPGDHGALSWVAHSSRALLRAKGGEFTLPALTAFPAIPAIFLGRDNHAGRKLLTRSRGRCSG
jgi:hypothetical protein